MVGRSYVCPAVQLPGGPDKDDDEQQLSCTLHFLPLFYLAFSSCVPLQFELRFSSFSFCFSLPLSALVISPGALSSRWSEKGGAHGSANKNPKERKKEEKNKMKSFVLHCQRRLLLNLLVMCGKEKEASRGAVY